MMPWICPACHLAIRHSAEEPSPHLGVTYRCHVCRLDLVVDSARTKMVVADSQSRQRDVPGHGDAAAASVTKHRLPIKSVRKKGRTPNNR
jgi:hypothetical protein